MKRISRDHEERSPKARRGNQENEEKLKLLN